MRFDAEKISKATEHANRSLWWLWMLISLAAAGWLVWVNRDDIAFMESWSTWLVVAMLSAQGLSLITQSERFRIILTHHSKANLSPMAWMRLFMRGRLFSFVIPQAGHVYKALALRHGYGTPGVRYFSSVAMQTWMGLVVSLGFATFIGITNLRADDLSVEALALSTVLVGLAPYSITRLWRFLPSRIRSSRVARRAREAWTLSVRSIKSKTLVAAFIALVLCGLAVSALALQIAFSIAGQGIGWSEAVGIVAFVHLGNLISITPGNLGIQELGVAALAVLFGYPPASGVVASAVIRLVNIGALVILVALLEGGALAKGPRRVV